MNDCADVTLIEILPHYKEQPTLAHLDSVVHQHGDGHGSNPSRYRGEIPGDIGNLNKAITSPPSSSDIGKYRQPTRADL